MSYFSHYKHLSLDTRRDILNNSKEKAKIKTSIIMIVSLGRLKKITRPSKACLWNLVMTMLAKVKGPAEYRPTVEIFRKKNLNDL